MRLGRGSIRDAAWRPDGKAIAVASSAGVWLYTDTLDDVVYLGGHLMGQVAWQPDGKALAAVGLGGEQRYYSDQTITGWAPVGAVFLWDTQTDQPLPFLPPGQVEGVEAVNWSPDGSRLLVERLDGSTNIWDASGKQIVQSLAEGDSKLYGIRWSPDGARLAGRRFGPNTGQIGIISAATGTSLITLAGRGEFSDAFAWNPDGTRLACGYEDGEVQIWDILTGQREVEFSDPHHGIRALAWSPDGTQLGTGNADGTIGIWSMKGTPPVSSTRLSGAGGAIHTLAWHPDGSRVLAAGDERLEIWDVASESLVARSMDYIGLVQAVSWSPDSTRLASIYKDIVARVWDTRTSKVLFTLAPEEVSTDPEDLPIPRIAWSPQGSQIAIGGYGLQLRDARTGQRLKTLEGGGFVAWSPDGQRLVTNGSGRSAAIWDVAAGQRLESFEPLPYARDGTWSPDGVHIATANDDWEFTSYIRVFNTLTHRFDYTLEGVPGAAWSPDGKRLATSNARWLQIRDSSTGLPQVNIQTRARLIAWHPSGDRLAANRAEDGAIVIWDAHTGQQLAVIPGAGSTMFTTLKPGGRLVWSPDGQYLANVDEDGTIRIWRETGAQPEAALPSPTPLQTSVLPPASTPAPTEAPIAIQPRLTLQEWRRFELGPGSGEVSLSPDGGKLLSTYPADSGTQVQARVFSLELGQQAFHFIANGWAWKPDGSQLATFINNTPTVSLLSGDTGVTQMTLRGHSAALTHLAWSPDGRWLAGSGDATDTTVRVWDTGTGQLAASLPGHVLAVRALVWSPDGRRLATVSWDSVMLVWDIADRNRLLLTAHNATGEPVWSHDSRYVAVGSDLTQLRIWNIDTGQSQVASESHQGVVWDTAWSADDRLVVSQSGDMSNDIFYAIDIWDLSIHKLVSAREPIGYAVLSTGWNSRSGLVVMLREDFSTLQVWTERTPVWRKLFEVDSSSAAYGVLSPNGRWVAIGTQAGKANQINLYDTESGSLTTHQVDGEAAMGWLLWTPDSAKLFGVDGRGKVIVWAVQEQ